MNIAETARKALEILDLDGWNKGNVARPYVSVVHGYRANSHCIGGAWNMALSGRPRWLRDMTVYEPLVQMIREQYPDFYLAPVRYTANTAAMPASVSPAATNVSFISAWNDTMSTTEADVRAILEKLAATDLGGSDA